MIRFVLVMFFFSFSTFLNSQKNEVLHLKTFYYDVDDFSLTHESMLVLAEFVNEVKSRPIEIIEIIGYVEKTGSPSYNHIKSKKRMSLIKNAIDTSIVIHQYNPINIDYPPAFLYSYSDGYNWRRVDIKYKYKDPLIILNNSKPIKKSINNQEKTAINQFENNIKDPEQDTVKYIQVAKKYDLENNNLNNLRKDLDKDSLIEKKDFILENIEKDIDVKNITKNQDSTNYSQRNINTRSSRNNDTLNRNLKPIEIKENSPKILANKKDISKDSLLKIEKNKEIYNPENSEPELINTPKIKVNKEPSIKEIKIKSEKLYEETGEVFIEGKTQDQIDQIIVHEKSSSSNPLKTNHPDLGMRLSKIRVSDLDKTIVLLNMNLEFEGDEPIIIPSSLQEMDDLVNFLIKNKSVDVFLRGHVCCGDEMPLSKKRAKHVYSELIRRGISEDRLRYQGYSNKLLLIDPELTELDRKKNRRVDIIFSKSKTRSENYEIDPVITIKDSVETLVDSPFIIEEKNSTVEIEENQNGELNTIGKTQDQIDKMLVREKSRTKASSKINNLDMFQKLERISISKLDTSVVLVIMGIEFNGVDPIINEISTKEMNDLFNFLNQNKQIHAFIRGHVCCGNDLKLSKKRAKYVYSQLISRGISSDRLRYQGFSNTLLLVSPEKNDIDRAKNRRVDIIFSIKK